MTPKNLPKDRHKKSTKKDQNGSMESVDNLAVHGSITSRDRLENFQSLGNLYSYQRSAFL